MILFSSGILFLLGVAIGSFLNVVIYRLHTGKSLQGRSHCLSCGKTLKWYELVPLISYIFLRGRCKTCGSYVPIRYFLVELFTGLSFLYLGNHFFGETALLILHFLLISLLITVFAYDIRHTIIPNELVIAIFFVAIAFISYDAFLFQATDFVSTISGGVVASGFFLGLWLYSKGKWIGLGDAKLAFPLGLIIGLEGAFSFIVVSFWIGAVVSILLLIVQYILGRGKRYLSFMSAPLTIKSEVPFAPFLIIGFLLVHLYSIDVFLLTYQVLFSTI